MRVAWLYTLVAVGCAGGPLRSSASPASPAATGADAPAELAYVDAGAGPAIVLIHGAWGDLRTFSRAIPVLATGHRLVAPSLRYHWPNPWAASDDEAFRRYTVETHARDVAALIERLGIAPVDLVGHSYGGNVAAVLALSRPDLVRRVVLLEPALRSLLRDSDEGQRIFDEMARERAARLARVRAGEDPLVITRDVIEDGKPGTFDALPAERRRLLIANARTTGPLTAHPPDETRFTCDDGRRLPGPVLLVRGERTERQSQMIVARLAECVPGARTVVLPGSRHVIQVDAPEAMARAVVEFLGDRK